MSTAFLQQIFDTVRDPLLVLNEDLSVRGANRAFYRVFSTTAEETVGHRIFDLSGGAWNTAALQGLLESILLTDSHFDDFEVEHEFPGLGRHTMVLNARRVVDAGTIPPLILLAIEDVTQRRRAESDLALHRAWLEVTLRSIGDAVIATDPQAQITFMNPTAERLTGWPEKEATGRPLLDIFNIVNEETRALVESPVAKALRMGAVVGLANHTILIARDGTEIPIDDSAAPIRAQSGDVAGVVMVFHDIADRREAERLIEASENRYRRLFEAARDGVLILDPATRQVIDANPYMEELLNTDRAGLIGKELWEIGVIGDQEQSRRTVDQLLSYGYVRYEDLPLQTSSGQRRDVEFVCNLYREDHHSVVQCNIRDITDRKRAAEREFLLERETTARQASEAANRAKDVFLATLSHELRTPLNAVLGWAVLLRTSGKCDDKDIAEGLIVIERNARAQAKLIEEALDLARIISGKFAVSLKPCDLAAVVAASVDAARPDAESKGLTIACRWEPVPCTVRGDPLRLQQAMGNLLSNAVKFTAKGGHINVGLERVNGTARVSVADNGRGIAPAFLPYVFDRFRQADSSTTRAYGGLGLGLTVVRHIVELHGGTIRAESHGENRGATFTIELPFETKAPTPAAATIGTPIPRLDGLSVVVIDDERDVRELVTRVLESAGAAVRSAACASEAFDLITKEPPRVVVCDIAMPHEDGYSLIRRVRATGLAARDLPAIALTAFVGGDDRHQALMSGFQVHVPKPVDPRELITVVASLCGRTGH